MLDQINKAFQDLDNEMLERQMTWVMDRMEALAEYTANFKRSEKGYTSGAIEICGGKKWYQKMMGSNKQMMAEFVAKNVASMIESRNNRIISALNKKGITEIPEFTLTHNSDGYEGCFNVAGHRVTIQTILAGGYNIQCLHQRTLIKAKAAA